MKNIFEIFRKKGGEEKPDYGSLQGLETSEGEVLRELPGTRKVLPTKRGMGEVVVEKPGRIVGGKSNG